MIYMTTFLKISIVTIIIITIIAIILVLNMINKRREKEDKDRKKILEEVYNSFSSEEKKVLEEISVLALIELKDNFKDEEIREIIKDIKNKNYWERNHILEILIKNRKEKNFKEIINKY